MILTKPFTYDTSILVMCTIMSFVTIVMILAKSEVWFCSSAKHIIQNNLTGPLSESCTRVVSRGPRITHGVTHDMGVIDVPNVITHGAPGRIVKDLDAALVGSAAAH